MPDLAGSKIAYLSFCGTIDEASATRIAKMLNAAVNERYDSVYITISSNGGYVNDGVYLYNHIRSLPIPVTFHNIGTVASIAATVFVAADTRYCSKNSTFMIHPVLTPAGQSTMAIETALKSALLDEQRIERILSDRTGLTEELLLERRLKDSYFAAEQALENGLIGGIKEFCLPPGNQIFQI